MSQLIRMNGRLFSNILLIGLLACLCACETVSPVLAQANSINTGVGHAFLIDAWRQSKTKYTYTYEWVPDVVNPGETIAVPPEIIIVYSAPTARFFSMNWGEGENYNNSWYSVMLSWEGFDLNRRIYYNFRRN